MRLLDSYKKELCFHATSYFEAAEPTIFLFIYLVKLFPLLFQTIRDILYNICY